MTALLIWLGLFTRFYIGIAQGDKVIGKTQGVLVQ